MIRVRVDVEVRVLGLVTYWGQIRVSTSLGS